MAYLSLQPSSHKIWPSPGNTATPLIRRTFLDPLVAVLTGFHCNELILGLGFPSTDWHWISRSDFEARVSASRRGSDFTTTPLRSTDDSLGAFRDFRVRRYCSLPLGLTKLSPCEITWRFFKILFQTQQMKFVLPGSGALLLLRKDYIFHSLSTALYY